MATCTHPDHIEITELAQIPPVATRIAGGLT